jgi:enamine deaminase RidA (YjgF/YER057c/UK114 family)
MQIMTIERIGTGARMSQAVIHNGTAYFCGQVAKDEAADMKGQTQSVLEKIEDLLAQVGSDKKNILSVTVYINSMDQFSAMNEVWDNWVESGYTPARACVEAQMARPELQVEMSVVAAIRT